MRAAFGSGAASDYTDASLDRLKNNYKMSMCHYVSPDLSPHADIAAQLKKHGITPIYDGEMAIWASAGFNVNLDISGFGPQLQAIKDAGWEGFSSEGVSQKQVEVIRRYLKYYNFGGENGENVYAAGSMYYRPLSMADGNYIECYHKGIDYAPAIKSANQSTPRDIGLTLMLYSTGELYYPDPTPLLNNWIDPMRTAGVNLSMILFWVGVNQPILNKLDSDFNFLWNALNNKYNFTVIVGGTDMFLDAVRGTDNHVWYQTRINGVFSKWISIDGITTSAPQVQYDSETGTFDIRVRGTDTGRYHNYYDPKTGKWSGWVSSGGLIRDICL